MPLQAGECEEAPSLVRRQREQGSLGQSLYCVFHGKGKAGKGNSLGLASLNTFGGLWDIRAVPSCLVLDPGLI